MTGPLASLLEQKPSSPLESALGQKAQTAVDDNTSIIKSIAWPIIQFARYNNVKSAMDNPMQLIFGKYNPDPSSQEGKMKAAIESQNGTFMDWVKAVPQMWENTTSEVKEAINSGIWQKVKDAQNVGSIVKGLTAPSTQLMELNSGMSLTDNDPKNLTPVEKATRVRDLVAFTAATAVGEGAGVAFESVVGESLAKGLIRGAIKGAAVGVPSAATYSLVQNPLDLKGAASAAILGAELGTTAGVLFGGGREVKGPDLAKVREMQPETNSVASQIGVTNAAFSSNDLASVILSGKVPLQPNIPWKIPGLDLAKLPDIEKSVPEGFTSAVHVGSDGTGKLLVYNKELFPGFDDTNQRGFFRRTGFLKDEQVSYNGKDNWSIQEAAGDEVTIRNESDGHIIDVPKSDIVESIQTKISGLDDATLDNFYNEWKSTLPDPTGYGEASLPAPTNLADRIPEIEGIGIKKHMENFLASKEFSDNQFQVLRRQLMGKLNGEATAGMDSQDRDFIRANRPSDSHSSTNVTVDDLMNAAEGGRLKARQVDGKYIISDQAGKAIKSFNNYGESLDFINKSGKSPGPELDDNPQLDYSGGSPPLPPDGGVPKYPQDEPFDSLFSKNELNNPRWGENFWKFITLQDVSWWTQSDTFLKHFDTVQNRALSPILNKLFELRNVAAGMTQVDLKKVGAAAKGFVSKPASMQRILGYLQTASPEELRAKFPESTIAAGTDIANSGVDIPNLRRFERAAERLKTSDPQYSQQLQALMKERNIGKRELAVKQYLDNIRGLPNENISIGNVLKYARSLADETGKPGLSKMEYVRSTNMNSKEINAAQQLMSHMNDLMKVNSIKSNIWDVLTHAKEYEFGNIKAAARDFELPNEPLTKLMQSGTFSAYTENPFNIQSRMVSGTFKLKSGFFDAIDNAKSEIKQQLKPVDPEDTEDPAVKYPASFKKAGNVITRAIADLQGVKSLSDRAVQEATEIGLGKFGMKDGALVKNVSRTLGRVGNLRFLDFRPQLGISHFFNTLGLTTAGRSLDFARRAVTNGFGRMDIQPEIEKLQTRGVFQAFAPYSVATSEADVGAFQSKVGEIVNKTEDLGFKATILPYAYDRWAVGIYNTAYGDVLSGLKDYSDGKINQKDLIKKLYLTRYDVPVIKEFNRLAESGKPEDAANYLSTQAVKELVGVFGKGSDPTGWGNDWGSLFVQYGRYTRFKWGAIARIVTRGTAGERLQSAAKLTAVHYGMQKLSDESGINFMKLDPLYDMFWLKSATTSEASDIITAMNGTGVEQQLAKSRLKKQFTMGFVPIPNVMIDYGNALDDFSEGNVGTGVAELAGFRKQPRR